MENKIPYIISALDYRTNSAGIVCLHLLCKLLNDLGYEAYTNAKITMKGDPTIWGNEHKLRQMIIDGAIAVYPEINRTNYLWSKNPVGWLLNKGEFQFEKEGLIFTYSKKYRDCQMFTILQREDFFVDDKNYNRKYNALYVGKGTPDSRINNIKDKVIITPAFPKTRKKLAKLLKQCKVLYTYDGTTALGEEARLCGCSIVLLENGCNTITDFEKNVFIDPKNNIAEVRKFIDITQKWAGERNG